MREHQDLEDVMDSLKGSTVELMEKFVILAFNNCPLPSSTYWDSIKEHLYSLGVPQADQTEQDIVEEMLEDVRDDLHNCGNTWPNRFPDMLVIYHKVRSKELKRTIIDHSLDFLVGELQSLDMLEDEYMPDICDRGGE